jgi:hypothetical protein
MRRLGREGYESEEIMLNPVTRFALAVVVAWLGSVVAGCGTRPEAIPESVTDADRAAIGETVRQLYRESSQTFDSDLDCEEIVARIAPEGQAGSFVSQGQLFEVGGHDELVEMCRTIKRNRLSAREEIEDERVEVLGPHAAVLVAKGVYTVRLRDNRTIVRPQVVTTVWVRASEGWRRVHLHESWPSEQHEPGAPGLNPDR